MNPTPEELNLALADQIFAMHQQIAFLQIINKKQALRIEELEQSSLVKADESNKDS